MSSQKLNSLNHCVFNIQFHLILVTKYRRRCFNDEILIRLENIFKTVIVKQKCTIVEFNGEVDHIHVLLRIRPDIQPSKLVNILKSVSSRYLRQEFRCHFSKYYWKPVLWSKSYCLISVGGAPIEILKRYIQKQDRPNGAYPSTSKFSKLNLEVVFRQLG